MRRPFVVVALGGNAISGSSGATADEQERTIATTARHLRDIIAAGWDMVVVHGNGPQVGNVVLQQQAANSVQVPAMPLDACDAMTQGMIGYWLQKALDETFSEARLARECATVVMQTVVDGNDTAFAHPSKPIGPFYTVDEAAKVAHDEGYVMREDAGRGWRRVVPSPKPLDLVELHIVRDLLRDGYVVITAGGGGIPVVRNKHGTMEGVEAVIDKDLTASLLARRLNADLLLILTSVPNVYVHYGTPRQKALHKVTTEQLRAYLQEGQFAPGSMRPKVEALVEFTESKSGRRGVITDLAGALSGLKWETGTCVSDSRTQ